MVGPKAFGHDFYSGEEVENAKAAFLDQTVTQINKMLEKRQFLIANNEPTVIDIIFYSEISTALYLLRLKGFQKRYPRVQAWIKLMSEVEGLLALDEKLVEMIEKYELE